VRLHLYPGRRRALLGSRVDAALDGTVAPSAIGVVCLATVGAGTVFDLSPPIGRVEAEPAGRGPGRSAGP
jgi:hypothetical protein